MRGDFGTVLDVQERGAVRLRTLLAKYSLLGGDTCTADDAAAERNNLRAARRAVLLSADSNPWAVGSSGNLTASDSLPDSG